LLQAGAVAWLTVTAATGCSSYGAHPRSPAQGGAAWHEVTSPHFRVLSDLHPPEIDAIVSELETALAAIGQMAFKDPRSIVEPTTVVVFDDVSDMHFFLARGVEGVFENETASDLQASRRMVFAGKLSSTVRNTCLHELTHDLFDRNFGPSPPWLEEGTAQYYSTTRVVDGRVVTGEALPELGFTKEETYFWGRTENGGQALAVPMDLITTPSRLLSMDRAAFYSVVETNQDDVEVARKAVENYLGAWAFVHMLLDGPAPYPERYQAFQREAVAGKRLQDAWETAFEGVPREQIDVDFRRYLAASQIAVLSKPFRQPPPMALRHRALQPWEVHLLWARLLPWSAKTEATVRSEFAEAIRLASAEAEPRYYRGVFHLKAMRLEEAEEDLRVAVAAKPDDGRYRLGMYQLRIQQAKVEETPRRLEAILEAGKELEARAKSAYELASVSELERELGNLDEALRISERAVVLAPIDPSILDVYGRALVALGRLPEAVVVMERAVSFLPEDQASPELVARLDEYRALARAAR
jgi:tetratricopeptide (TPR) repeat protein